MATSDIDTVHTVDYTQGFGSFDFFPHDTSLNVRSLPWRVDDTCISSSERSNVVKGPKTFPFLRLPLEIRRRIYRFLLARLFPGRHLHLHENAVADGIRFVVEDTEYSPGWFEVDYDLHVPGPAENRTVDDRGTSDATFHYIDVLDTYKKSTAYDKLQRQSHATAAEEADDPDNRDIMDIDPNFRPSLGWLGTDNFLRQARQPTWVDNLRNRSRWELMEGTDDESESSNCSMADSDDCWDSEIQSEADHFDTKHRHAVNVTIGRVMHPDPFCDVRCHDPDANWFSYESPDGPYPDPDLETPAAPPSGELESFTGTPNDPADRCTCDYRTRDDYRAVHQLSRVSKQFTAELGSVLWANSTLEIREPAAFAVLARTRPEALWLVRSVVLHVSCCGDFSDTDTGLVKLVCDFFFPKSVAAGEEASRLRSFTVVLSVMSKAVPPGFRHPEDQRRCYNFADTARERMKELGEVFRSLEMRPGASFHVRLGCHLPTVFLDRSEPGSFDMAPSEVGKFVLGKIRPMLLPEGMRKKEEWEREREAGFC
ncbi:hypothetical protein B0T14DRAFT_314764 [Immersiella caudata]|uniref:Uncharacterized protein n=1 Tax=Immersiella caudata TaxID=314043 RepID=A0AA39T1B8_9PEZI|nr:hypothetical protein B0T14DRAFT_314764 [Immersiella caudata]